MNDNASKAQQAETESSELQRLWSIKEVGEFLEMAVQQALGARYRDFTAAKDPDEIQAIHAECRAIQSVHSELYGVLQNLMYELDGNADDKY